MLHHTLRSQACSWLEVDIIRLDLGQKLPFRLRPKLLAAALARGVVFEVGCLSCRGYRGCWVTCA